MIQQNLETLNPGEQLLLEAASVAGREFVASVLASSLGWTEDETELRGAALARQGTFIRDAGVLEWPSGGVSSRFRFIHALYREVVYRRVPAGRRARLHQVIGVELEKAYGDQAQANANQLARHFRYGAITRAIRYSPANRPCASVSLAWVLVERRIGAPPEEFEFRSMLANDFGVI
jgi:predicted ATPase